TAVQPAAGSTVAMPLGTLTFDFNEPYLASSVAATDLTISQGTVSGVSFVDADTVQFNLSGITTEGTLNFSIAAGAITDVFGNSGPTYTGSLTLDAGTIPFPVPLAANLPLGSLVYGATYANLLITAGDMDNLTISLDAGQSATVVAHPTSTLRPTVSLLRPDGSVLSTVSATAAGQDSVLQNIAVDVAGTYTISISGAAGTTGSLSVE